MKVNLIKTILAPLRKPKTHLKTITSGLSSFTKALCLLGILTTTIGLSSCKKDPVTTTQISETTYAWWDFDGEHYESKVNYICNACKPINSYINFNEKEKLNFGAHNYYSDKGLNAESCNFGVSLWDLTANKKEYEFNSDLNNDFSVDRDRFYTASDSLNGSWVSIKDPSNKFTMIVCDTIKKRLEFVFNIKIKRRFKVSGVHEIKNGHIIIKY